MTTKNSKRAFTLIEMMITITALTGIITVGYVGFSEMSASVKAQKLEKDISTINSSINVYIAHGGEIGTLSSPQSIIDKLKTRPTSDNAKQIAGMRGSMVDPRLEVVMQSVSDAESSDPRASWNAAQKRFVVLRDGDPGIEGFKMNKARILTTPIFENRNVSLKFAKTGTWVWDYIDTDNGTPNSFGPVNVGSTSSIPFGLPNTPAAPLALNPPSFSSEGGTYPLSDYETFEVSLTDPNPAGSAQVFCSTDGANWTLYQGETFSLSPNDMIEAIAVTLDPDTWADSPIQTNTYSAQPVQLAIGLGIPKNPVRYPDVGGVMIDGSSSPVGPISISLSNFEEVPNRYQNSDTFNIVWSYDGSDPLQTPAATGATFSGGFAGVSVDYSLDKWGANTVLPIKVAAQSLDTGVLANSEVSSAEISIDRISLREPVSNLATSGSYTSNQVITLAPNSGFGDVPQGWRIYYTSDGTDPGYSNSGEPLRGSLYTGTFDLFSGSGVSAQVNARVYGPSGYGHWFNPSPLFSADLTRWDVPVWNGYVGGDFSNRTYSFFNNIKQHLVDGPIDISFNPGDGLNNMGRAVVLQADGKAVVGGDFTAVDGYSRNRIVRFNVDGTVDTSFDPGSGFDGVVMALAIQPDGKVLVGGQFSNFAGVARKGLARLNADGSLDTTFVVGEGVHNDGWVHAIALQAPPTETETEEEGEDVGLLDGHFDLDTSSFIADLGHGSTDGHVHEYDDKHDVVGADFFNLLESSLHNISEDISDPNQKFKLIISNADLSPGGRLVINGEYDPDGGSEFVPVKDYDNSSLASLPIYSLGGISDTIKLEDLGIYFAVDTISQGGLVPTNTGDVKGNTPGLNGEWRNGALTIQAVAVNANGSDAFSTSNALSAGGVQGVATSGLLWEATLFWHWDGDSYHDNPGYLPGDGGNGSSDLAGPPCLIVLDAEAIDSDVQSIEDAASSHGRSADWLINTDEATENGNPWLKWSQYYAGDEVLLPAGQEGDEGWYGLPASLPWSVEDYADGTVSQSNLDKIANVKPLDETGISTLIGKKVIAVVYKSDVGMNYDPDEANLQGERRGRIAFTVLGLEPGPDYGFVRVRIESPDTSITDACDCTGTGKEAIEEAVSIEEMKIVIGGCFSRYDGESAQSLARLDMNGSLDEDFDTKKGVSGYLHSVAVQPDGMVVIGGSFDKYNGKKYKNLARVKIDGKEDKDFKIGKGVDKEVYTVSLYPDGKIFVGGRFNNVDKKKRKGVARIKSNGKVDNDFDIGNGSGIPSWTVYTSAIDGDGRVLIGGHLQAYNSTSRSPFIRLNTDGQIDTSYTPEDLPQNSEVRSIALRPDDRALITGLFPESFVSYGENVAKLNTESGDVDDSFDVGEGANGVVHAVLKLSDGDVMIGGSFSEVRGSPRTKLAKVGADGTLSASSIQITGGDVFAITELEDGKIMIGGSFTAVDGIEAFHGIARLNADGSVDGGFTPAGGLTSVWVAHPSLPGVGYYETQSTYGFDGAVSSILPMGEGAVLIGGNFSNYGGQAQAGVALLNADASLDTLYSATVGSVNDSLVMPLGQVVLVGNFDGKVARILTDGSADPDFTPAAINGSVHSVALLQDGRLLIGGDFTRVGDQTRHDVAVLAADGSVDMAFDPAGGTNGSVTEVVALPDGGAVIMGAFTQFSGEARKGTARLTAAGTLDTSFVNSTLEVISINSTD